MKISGDYYDAAVVGAGVAGGATAVMLARRGLRVVLIEKSAWPRDKVCGGCLSAAAVAALRRIGIGCELDGADLLDSVVWYVGGRALEVAIPRGAAILRRDLDAAVVSKAIECGCEFWSNCSATLLPVRPADSFRTLKVRDGNGWREIRAGVVIAADGIGGTLLAGEPWAKWVISPAAWIGVAATCESHEPGIVGNRIHMHVGNNGYVGMVRIDGSHEHLAAALDPKGCRRAGGPGKLLREILASCGRGLPAGFDSAKLRGAGALTRRRNQLGGHRVLCVGDACGYVEPFTGEGMAWALQGASELVEMLPGCGESWAEDLPARWRRRYVEIIGRQQRWCGTLRPIMRHSTLAAAGIHLGGAMPALTRWIAEKICQRPTKEIRDDSSGDIGVPYRSTESDAGDIGDRDGEPAGGEARVGAGTGDGIGVFR